MQIIPMIKGNTMLQGGENFLNTSKQFFESTFLFSWFLFRHRLSDVLIIFTRLLSAAMIVIDCNHFVRVTVNNLSQLEEGH